MPQPERVSGFTAAMTVVAMGLGSAVVLSDLRIMAANISILRSGLQFSPATTVFVASLATMTLAASVLGAGVLGDRYGMKRMFVAGACGAVVCGFLAAAAPNVIVLMIARAGIGVAFGFLSSLSLAIINAVFPTDRRAGAIAWYLAAVYAFGTAPVAAGSLLTEQIGWRSGFLVAPVLTILVLLITLRYVPETPRSDRKTDIPGLLLVAVALIGLTYGISQLQGGEPFAATAPILVGLIGSAAFVWWELRCDDPALDLGIFRSPRFNAVVTAGAANNLVQGGSMIMVTYYLVVIRGLSTVTFALLLIPATLLSALAAVVAGWAAARLGNCAVVVAGLAMLAVSLLVRLPFEVDTPIVAVAAAMTLTVVGGAVLQTPQTTVMMSSAPTHLGGVVSAVKASVAGTFNGFGSALFATLAIALFIRDADAKLAGSGVSARQAGEFLGATAGAPEGAVLDPAHAQWVISQASSSMLGAADDLNLIMTIVPVTAIAFVLWMFRRKSDAPSTPAWS